LSEREIEGFIFGRRGTTLMREKGQGLSTKEGHRASRKLAAE